VSFEKPVVWSVAGSDSGSGAGVQADLKAFEAWDVHGCTAIAALTAQNSTRVLAIEAVSDVLLDAQLSALANDMPPAAIKTGMLGNVANLRVLVRHIDRLRASHPALPVIVDPVLRSTTGTPFVDDALLSAYRHELLPRASLVTPNRVEAALLAGLPPLRKAGEVEQAAHALREAGCAAIVITGGDESAQTSDDFMLAPFATGWLSLPRLATPHHHGTGCVFAASAAAAMAQGFVTAEAAVLAKMATTEALRHGYAAGRGAGPVRPAVGFAARIDNLPSLLAPVSGTRRDAPLRPSHIAFASLVNQELGLYAIVDSADWVLRVLAAGVRTVQLRIKDANHTGLRDEVRASVAAARAANAQLFINDHWQMALSEGAYGVHLGQEDLATADLAAIAAAGLRLGVSTHAYWEVCRAWALQPSYIACGPIHPTKAKAMPWIAQGNGNLAYWCSLLPTPVVAIAGMDGARATEAMQCGAAGVAVISAITAADSSENRIATLQQAIEEGRRECPFVPPAMARPTLNRE
jgi:hydroxymethylpyrimidine kinase / phosphomethylpyrimidine kinase / thiamine-phosphate diphosphorylase